MKTDFGVDLNLIDPTAASVIFPNPNAITGIALPIEEVERFIHDNPSKLVIIDEAYADFSKASCSSLICKYKNLIVTQTFSKSRGMAGLRVGFCFGNETLINGLRSVKNSFNSYPIDIFANLAAISAIEDTFWFDANINKIIEIRSYFSNELEKMGFKVLPSSANFVLITHPSIEAHVLQQQLTFHKVLVRRFSKSIVSNWLRITVGTLENCDLVLSILKQKIEESN